MATQLNSFIHALELLELRRRFPWNVLPPTLADFQGKLRGKTDWLLFNRVNPAYTRAKLSACAALVT